MTDTLRSLTELQSIFADGQPARSISAQDVRDLLLSLDTRIPFGNVKQAPYLAKGDGVTDDTAAFLALIAASLSRGLFVVPVTAGGYKIASTITVDKPLTFLMDGATITMPTANTPLFNVTSSDVHFKGGKLVGPQYAAQQTNSNAIQFVGASAAAPVTDVSVKGVQIESWGMHGIFAQYVEDFDFSRNKITNVYYGGIGTSSAIRGTVHRNRIRNIVGSPNAYGIYFSRLSTASLVTDPRSADITCSGNVVKDVTNWEGIDTHGGQGITISGNRVTGCFIGILVGGQTDGVNPAFAPLDCNVTGNTIDSKRTDGTAKYGIAFVGAAGTLGASVEKATGSVVGNTIRGHGEESNGVSGAIYVHDTIGVVVSGNVGIECSPFLVYMADDNFEFIVSNNTAIDPWSTSYSFPGAINIGADYQTGIVSGNTLAVGSKSAAHINVWGVRIGASLTNSQIVLGTNRFANASTPYSIGTTAAVKEAVHASPFQIGDGGTPLTFVKVYTPSLTPVSVAANTTASQNFSISGLLTTDKVVINGPDQTAGVGIVGARVSASNTLRITFSNNTAGALTPASGTYNIIAFRS